MLQDPREWVAFVLPGLPHPTTASRSFLASQVLSLTGYQKFISLEQNYNHV
nr:MAG TPA: hypothetical protein [Caudoviricetes sp.]